MARLPRLAAPGLAHLVLQRGNSGQRVFADDLDRVRYLTLLGEAARACQVAIHAYALTDSEVLLLATPVDERGLSRMMQAIGRRYVSEFNRRHGRSGSLWDGRFRSTTIEAETQLQPCLAFVELAPVRAGNAAEAPDHRWSSARHHVGMVVDPLISEHPRQWATGNTPFDREAAHRRRLEAGLDDARTRQIAESAAKGWALGSPAFAASLAERIGRRVLPARRGRPRVRAAESAQ
jgi:putative transposase